MSDGSNGDSARDGPSGDGTSETGPGDDAVEAETDRRRIADVDADAPVDELAERLRAELAATEELPVEREASRWMGEAQAVAADAASADLDEAVVRTRIARVGELLAHVETTGDERADARVERARRLAAAIDGED